MGTGTDTDEEKALQTVATLVEEHDNNGARLTDAQEVIENIRSILQDEGYLEEADEEQDEDEDGNGDDD